MIRHPVRPARFTRPRAPFCRRWHALLVTLLWLAVAPVANAAGDDETTRLKQLSEELRCMVCQNQTLADSNAELAVDLRNQVKALIGEGRSDDEIKRYLVDRYGQFVLYKPAFQTSTLLLWAGPFLLLAIGAGVWWRLGRQRAVAATAATGPAPSSLDAARRLLDDR